nr:NAD(+) synthase [Maliibacterium massiliense]
MRDYAMELEKRVAFIQRCVREAGAKGVVYGNSGGKDSALVGILCRRACDDVLGVMMPCQSKRNFEEDMRDALAVAERFDIPTVTVDLTPAKEAMEGALSSCADLSGMAGANINPRLRMSALYAIAQSRGALVAGTGNRSERVMGYFTKWGDGACDFNPIADLTVTEVYAFLRYLSAPESIIAKAPSAGLFEGQTDEQEMGITYSEIDNYLLHGQGDARTVAKIEGARARGAHKTRMPLAYGEERAR